MYPNMKKIFFLFVTLCVLAACDPVHEDINNGNHITADELKAMSTVIVDKVIQIGDQKTYKATKGTPITLLENIDVKGCNGIVVYFADKVDKYWEISISPDGNFEKIPGGSNSYRCDFGNKEISTLNQIVLKHTEDTEENTVTVKAIYKCYGDKVAPGVEGQFGNVIVCQTSAPVNAKWDIGGKEFVGNYASKKMKVNWDENGDYITTPYTIVLTGICPDGTKLTVDFPVECDKISNPLVKFYIFGDPNRSDDEKAEDPQLPFKPAAWDAAAMRFSSTEGAHLPTISDEIYFGLKTLIFDVSDVTPDFDLKVMNGWWSNTYYDHVKWVDGLNELQITQTMANECAKGSGGEGRDLDLMLYSGSMTLNTVYYEE
jgi:hypothetical protein